jgi:hypothetical protein
MRTAAATRDMAGATTAAAASASAVALREHSRRQYDDKYERQSAV